MEDETVYFVRLSVCVTLEGPRSEHTRKVIHENVMDRLAAGDEHDIDEVKVIEEVSTSKPTP